MFRRLLHRHERKKRNFCDRLVVEGNEVDLVRHRRGSRPPRPPEHTRGLFVTPASTCPGNPPGKGWVSESVVGRLCGRMNRVPKSSLPRCRVSADAPIRSLGVAGRSLPTKETDSNAAIRTRTRVSQCEAEASRPRFLRQPNHSTFWNDLVVEGNEVGYFWRETIKRGSRVVSLVKKIGFLQDARVVRFSYVERTFSMSRERIDVYVLKNTRASEFDKFRRAAKKLKFPRIFIIV